MKRALGILVMLALMTGPAVAGQQSARTTFQVSVRVDGLCEISTVARHSGLRARCTPETGYRITTVDPGATVIGIGTGSDQDHVLSTPPAESTVRRILVSY